MSLNRLKGTKDLLSDELSLWQFVEEEIKKIAKSFAFKEIRTPIIEYSEVFKRAIGEETDVVSKEMFEFSDQKGRSICLRPEGTASVIRAFCENGLFRSQDKRFYYMGPMFRAENPQKGRQRQFHQLGIEIFGDKSAQADFDIISFNVALFKSLKLKNYTLYLNSVGDPNCRPQYIQALKDYLKPHINGMCKNCQTRYETNTLRVLDCKEEKCKEINKNAPSILDHLCSDCHEHFEDLKAMLDAADIKYILNPKIVRGLDYYSKTAFEFVFEGSGLGAQNTVCGGGRYDALVGYFDPKNPTPGVGSAIGLERLLLVLEEQKTIQLEINSIDYYFISSPTVAKTITIPILTQLREKYYSILTDFSKKNFRKKLNDANKKNALNVLILDENEAEQKQITIKNMQNGEQKTLNLSDFLNNL